MPEQRPITITERIRRFFSISMRASISGLFEGGRWSRELWSRFVTFMDRFHVGGWRRWVFVEPLSEMATFGAVGLVLMLALAMPAFYETRDEDWLKKSELAVQFLDRYGNEVGARGIKHNDSDPAGRVSGPSDQGDAGHGRPQVLRAFRHRRAGHGPRGVHQCAGRWRRAGRLISDPAARQKPVFK